MLRVASQNHQCLQGLLRVLRVQRGVRHPRWSVVARRSPTATIARSDVAVVAGSRFPPVNLPPTVRVRLRPVMTWKIQLVCGAWFLTGLAVAADNLPSASASFVQKHCLECHDRETKKGGFDLTALKFDPSNSTNFARWVLVHDRVSNGEMPPKKKPRP